MKPKSAVYKHSVHMLKSIVRDVFKDDDVKVILLGSRVRADYLETPDIDVAILPGREVKQGKLALMRGKIEISNIPYKVDVVDLSRAPKSFTQAVLKEGKLIWGH